DARGDLLGVEKMDGARWFTADVARGKAFLTATFGRPSADLAANADNPFFRSMLSHFQGQIVFAAGAVPILQGGIPVGAIGTSGGTGEQDAECAAAGAAAL
ncbi:MAG: heme-binding protein, partial [Chloroflexi bacterium]|nr:heme-binding protein [Chloroflexota bacterium]